MGVAVSMSTACSESPVDHTAPQGNTLNFTVLQNNNWTGSSTGNTEERATQNTRVFKLRGENASDTLFVHTSFREEITRPVTGDAPTRALPVDQDSFYDEFGVHAAIYSNTWDENACVPDYMYNVRVTRASNWSTSYYWPGQGHKIRFFAYAPYNEPGIVLSEKNAAGIPTITYSVPEEVTQQKDLLVAASNEMNGDMTTTAPLNFEHALTAVRFVTGREMLPGQISQITLKGVYRTATHTMGGMWGQHTDVSNFTHKLSVNTDGTPEQAITSPEATFMMIPQTLPADASIEVVYTDKLTQTRRTLTASIADSEWPKGQTIVYRISTTSIDFTPTFSITPTSDFSHLGQTNTYSVTSYATVSRPGDAEKKVSMAWTAEFVEDDGAGGYRVISQPDWVTAFTLKGDGGETAASFDATITAQNYTSSNPHNDILKKTANINATTGKTPYHLANPQGDHQVVNTANCYVVGAPGTYSLPLVYGNAVKNANNNPSAYSTDEQGANILSRFVDHMGRPIADPYIFNNNGYRPNNAVLVWQDELDLVRNIRLSDDRQRIVFDVNAATIKQGNAIIAVRDASNTIMWSWHIWVTDLKLDQEIKTVTNHDGKKFKMPTWILGWCDGETRSYAARSVKVRFTQETTGASEVITLNQPQYEASFSGNQPFYQFGRKDPMLPGLLKDVAYWPDKECHGTEYKFKLGSTTQGGASIVSIEEGIKNPHVFYNTGNMNNWCNKRYDNLWDITNTAPWPVDKPYVKTVYDPSPVGFHVPKAKTFTGFVFDGDKSLGDFSIEMTNSPYKFAGEFNTSKGWRFYCNTMLDRGKHDPSGGDIFFYAVGYRDYDFGKCGLIGNSAMYWTAGSSHSEHCGHGLVFSFYSVATDSDIPRNDGCAIRPVQD